MVGTTGHLLGTTERTKMYSGGRRQAWEEQQAGGGTPGKPLRTGTLGESQPCSSSDWDG